MNKSITQFVLFALCLPAFGVTAHAADRPRVPCPDGLLAAAHAPTAHLLGKDLHQVVGTRRQAAVEAIVQLSTQLEQGARVTGQNLAVEFSIDETLSPPLRAFLLERLRATFSYRENDPRSSALLFEGGEEIDALLGGLDWDGRTIDEAASVKPAFASGLGKLLMSGGALGAFIAAKSAQFSVMLDTRPRGLLAELLGIARPEPDYSTQNALLFWSALAFGAGVLVWSVSQAYYPKPSQAWPEFAKAISKKMRKGIEASEDPRFFSVTGESREMDLVFWVQLDDEGKRTPRMLLLAR
jgi:hypothetical protein